MPRKIEQHKGILGIITNQFNFSTDTPEEKQRLQKTIYTLQAGGLKLGYGFDWYSIYGPCSTEIVTDGQEVLNFEEYEITRDPSKWNFDERTQAKINEIRTDFIDPANTPRKLELLTSFHMFYYTWHQNDRLLPYELKQKFREKKTITFNDHSPITNEQLTEAMIRATNLIAYKRFHESSNQAPSEAELLQSQSG